jgi:hypothetical protein
MIPTACDDFLHSVDQRDSGLFGPTTRRREKDRNGTRLLSPGVRVRSGERIGPDRTVCRLYLMDPKSSLEALASRR